MKIYKELYVSETLRGKEEKIFAKIEQGKFQIGIYLVVLANGKQNNLECYNAALLLQHNLKTEDLFVVGVAKGYGEALAQIEQIANEVYEKTQDLNIREYIVKRQNEITESRM